MIPTGLKPTLHIASDLQGLAGMAAGSIAEQARKRVREQGRFFREVLFLVSGREKAVTLKQVLGGPFRPRRFPAQIVRPPKGRVTWLADREAAAELDGLGQDSAPSGTL